MIKTAIIKKLKGGKYRLYSRKKDNSGKRQNLGTYPSLEAVKNREKEIQFFKQHADDGKGEDKGTKIVSKLSDIASFLERAGYVSAADKVYCAMDAVDGSFSDDEDYLVDSIVSNTPDVQNALPGSMDYMMTGGVPNGMMSTFNPGLPHMMAALANKLDEKGLHDEADEVDEELKKLLESDMPDFIKELEKKQKSKKKHKVEPDAEEKEGVNVIVDSNGHVPTSVNQHSGFSGFSDAYFYSGYGNLEAPYGGN